jgi:phenylalanyl-tRNA synthetase alpha chain
VSLRIMRSLQTMAIDDVLRTFHTDLGRAETPEAIQELRVRYLGKKSELKTALKSLGSMPAEERPAFAKQVNDATADRIGAVFKRGGARRTASASICFR